jgi:hypothetical protein
MPRPTPAARHLAQGSVSRLPRASRAVRAALVVLAALSVVAFASCSNSSTPCSAPTSGSFMISLHYSQSLPIDLVCDASTGEASAGDGGTCGSETHPFDGATWTVAIAGNGATVTSKGATWSCESVGPQSGPGSTADGSTLPGSGCYLLVTCDVPSFASGEGDAGKGGGGGSVQIQILPKSSSNDVLALVHETSGACCSDEYLGTWQ